MKMMPNKLEDNQEIYNFVKGHPFFTGVAFEEFKTLIQLCEWQCFDENEVIFQAKKTRVGLFLLLTGVAEVLVKGEQTEEVLEVVQQGELIGFSSLADFLGVSNGTKYEQMVEVKAVDQVTGLLIPFSVVEKRFKESHVRDYLLQQVASRLKDIYASLAEQVKLSRQFGESKRIVMRVQDVLDTPPLSVTPTTSVQHIAQKMSENRSSSIVVIEKKKLVGIITERDLVNRVMARGESFDIEAKDIMTGNPYTVSRFSYFYDALSIMILNGIKHLPVVDDEKHHVVGIVTLADLLQKRNESMVKTIQRLEDIGDQNVCQVKDAIYDVLETMLEDQAPILHTLDVITTLYDRLVNRCVELAVSHVRKEKGHPPVSFCLYLMGSAGRGEQFILTDQDHFLVYEDVSEEKRDEVDQYFARLGQEIVHTLEQAGYALCKGKMMSSENQWRGSVTRWQERLRYWMLHATGNHILLAQNFFSFRLVYGEERLLEEFIERIQERLEGSKIFLYRMAQLEKESPVPTLDQPIRSLFRLERKKIDMKKEVLFPFHHSLQILSLAYEIVQGTPSERIDRLVQKNVLTKSFASDLKKAFSEIMTIYVTQKHRQFKRKEETSSVLAFTHLTSREKEDLILTLKTLRELQAQMFGAFSI